MSALQVEIFVTFFALALALSIAAEGVGVPAAALLVVVGAALHGIFHISAGFKFGPAVLFLFLPPLIFEAAWSLDLGAVKKRLGRVMYLAIPGTILTAGIVAFALTAAHTLPLASALIFGAIIAATDPVAVVSTFRRVQIPGTVKTIVEAESLANDGIAVVLYTFALKAAQFGFGGIPVSAWIAGPLFAVGGGALLGAAIAVPAWFALRTTRSADYEVAMTVVLAYVSYLSAEHFSASGIIATCCSAIALRELLRRNATLTNRADVNVFWSASATLVNTFVFFVTGLLIEPGQLLQSPLLVVMAVAGMLVARAVLAVTAAKSLRARMVIFLAGMRGALPLALALSLPHATPDRGLIINSVAAAVIISLLINGVPLEPAIRYLYRAGTLP